MRAALCFLQAVALQGALPGYQLSNADLTCSTMSELSVYNIRCASGLQGTIQYHCRWWAGKERFPL